MANHHARTKARRAFRLLGALVSVCAAATTILLPDQAKADPFGSNHGAAVIATAYGGTTIQNSIGASASLTVPAMDVAASCAGVVAVYYYIPAGCTLIDGGSARPIQVIPAYPPSQVTAGSFQATGLAAGCILGICSGINARSNGEEEGLQ